MPGGRLLVQDFTGGLCAGSVRSGGCWQHALQGMASPAWRPVHAPAHAARFPQPQGGPHRSHELPLLARSRRAGPSDSSEASTRSGAACRGCTCRRYERKPLRAQTKERYTSTLSPTETDFRAPIRPGVAVFSRSAGQVSLLCNQFARHRWVLRPHPRQRPSFRALDCERNSRLGRQDVRVAERLAGLGRYGRSQATASAGARRYRCVAALAPFDCAAEQRHCGLCPQCVHRRPRAASFMRRH